MNYINKHISFYHAFLSGLTVKTKSGINNYYYVFSLTCFLLAGFYCFFNGANGFPPNSKPPVFPENMLLLPFTFLF